MSVHVDGERIYSFLMDSRNGEMSLSTWLAQKKLREADYEAWKLYEMDAGEAFVDRTSRPKEIDAFVKDAYGLPYVPGSSVKGMFRTALWSGKFKKSRRHSGRSARKSK